MIATVIGARVVVIALGRRSADAYAGRARVTIRADIAVTAGVGVIVGEYTTGRGIARVAGTCVVVVARQGGSRLASSILTCFLAVADVRIGTSVGIVGHVSAAQHRVATVIGAGVVVAAIGRRSAEAHARGTGILFGANVAIAAGVRVIIGIDTAADWIARVVGTSVVVVASQRSARRTGSG